MFSNPGKRVTIIPTINNISQSRPIEFYLKQMMVEGCLMPICLVDNSDSFTYGLNRRYLSEVREELGKDIIIYHFGVLEQERFFKELIKNGVDNSFIVMLKTSSGYGVARNKCFIFAKSICAESIFFFDDDTRPDDNIFKKHYDILGTKKGSQKISVVSGPYKGARGVDFSFIENPRDQIRFLEAIGHHGDSSLNYLKKSEERGGNTANKRDGDKIEAVKNIRGGNFLIDKVYEDIVCPTMKQTPGIDDTFIARRVIEKGCQVVKSQFAVIHERFKIRRNEASILKYIESWGRALAFELLYDGASCESAIKRVLKYGRGLCSLESRYCKRVGENLLNRVYVELLVKDIAGGLSDYQRLREAWKLIIDVSSGIKVAPLQDVESTV